MKTKKIRIGIITLHHSYSYGACLQAFATKAVLEGMGFEVSFINYLSRNNIVKLISYRTNESLIRNFKNIVKNIFLGAGYYEHKAFSQFFNELKSEYALTYDSSKLNTDGFDLLVTGSDQLWNVDLLGGIEEPYFLNFVHNIPKVAIATSAGTHVFTESEKNAIKPWINEYKAISVREMHLKKQLEKVYNGNIEVMCDPTILLSSEEWEQHTKDIHRFECRNDYILIYLVGIRVKFFKEHYSKIIDNLRERFGIDVLVVNNSRFKIYKESTNVSGLSPWELLSAIKNARIVVTSSFHGTVFSILFNKPLIELYNPDNPARVEELLGSVGMKKVLVQSYDDYVKMQETINYDDVNPRIEAIRKKGISWIRYNVTV